MKKVLSFTINDQRSRKNGFTMIELLVVATIMIVLTTIGLTSFQSAARNSRNGKRKADLESVRSSLVLYRTDMGSYPIGTSFSEMLTTITDYISSDYLEDPKNAAPFVYAYTSDGVDFTLCATLEPAPGTAYCVTNP